jgi:hypothetical protein
MSAFHRAFMWRCSTGAVEMPMDRVRRPAARTAQPTGNARLTALAGAVLLVLLAVEGLTLVSLQRFISWHILVGILLVPVVALKVASTGYRFVRYYTRHEAYVRAGPPHVVLRLLGPVLVLATAALFATGVALALLGPGAPLVLPLHKASFVIWFGAMAIHVLGHLARMLGLVRDDVADVPREPTSRLRLGAVAFSIVVGAMLAVAAAPLVPAWRHVVVGG